MKHTPTIRLSAAKRAYVQAQEACPHWDYESDGDGAHDCCEALRAAQDELRLARKVVSKEGA